MCERGFVYYCIELVARTALPCDALQYYAGVEHVHMHNGAHVYSQHPPGY